MIFANRAMLWLSAVGICLLAAFLWWGWRKRQALTARFIQSRLLSQLTVGVSKKIQLARILLLGTSATLLFLALARPQWGLTEEEATQRGLDIIVAIDTSRSMLAEDISPSRLERAKLAAIDLMEIAKSDRLGLIAFAGSAFLQCPLTLDEEVFRQSVLTLNVGIIPQGGTAITEAIETALATFEKGEDNHRALVILTDGEDHEEGVQLAIERASKAGLRIFTVGVGTPNGELIKIRDDSGATVYLKDSAGNVVKSRLNESLLKSLATDAGGVYLPLTGANTMEVLYEKGLAMLPKGEISSKSIQRNKERFQWFLAPAILLIIAELLLPNRKRIKALEAYQAKSAEALRRATAILILFSCSLTAWSSAGSALKHYENGKYKEAQSEYKRLLEKNPGDAKLNYNAGAASYQAGSYDEALRHFTASLASPDLDLQQLAFYNLGNTYYRAGEALSEPQQQMASWEQAIKQYEASLKLNPNDPDARHNLELVKKKLDQLKQQQKQEQQQQNDSKNNEEKENQNKDQQQEQKDKQESKDQKKKEDQNQKESEEQDKQSQKNQESSGQNEQPKSEEEKKQEEQPNSESQDKPDSSLSQNGKSEDESKEKDENAEPSQIPAIPGKMTPQQAKELLDAQKRAERPYDFRPTDKKQPRPRIFKDW